MAAPKTSHKHETDYMDWIGVCLSGACLVHCLLLPFLISVIPLLSIASHNPVIHWVLAALITPVGLFAFWRGYVKHRSKLVFTSGLLGLLLVVLSSFSHSSVHSTPVTYTIMGSGILLLSHLRNWWLLRCKTCLHGELT